MSRMKLNDREQELFQQIRQEKDASKRRALRREWKAVVDEIQYGRPFNDRAKELELLTRINNHEVCLRLLDHAAKLEHEQQKAKAAQ